MAIFPEQNFVELTEINFMVMKIYVAACAYMRICLMNLFSEPKLWKLIDILLQWENPTFLAESAISQFEVIRTYGILPNMVFVLTIYAPDNIQTVGGASAQSQDHRCDMDNLILVHKQWQNDLPQPSIDGLNGACISFLT